MLKVVVLSCSTGGGHNSCGKYIQEELILNNIECDFVDYFSILGNKLSKRIEKLYLKSTKGKGRIFKNIYKLGETYNKIGLTSPVYELNKLAKNKVLKFIQANQYDLIICPHLFPAMAITSLKKEGYNLKLINVATDYTIIPFWNETTPDYFVIPHESLKEEFMKKGFKENTLLPLGIPISSNFLKISDSVKLKKDKPNILVTSGSMGFGNLDSLVQKLLKEIDAYIIVICGNNQKLLKKLTKINNSNLIVKGFVHNMNAYIKECDVILTKPGGLTSTEVAVLNKPMIHILPIPGVENYNATFYKNNHLSLVSKTVDEIINNTKELLKDKKMQAKMLSWQKKIINKNSGSDLVEFIKKKI